MDSPVCSNDRANVPVSTRRKYRLINAPAIRAWAKLHGRRTGQDFLQQLETHVAAVVVAACHAHNGGKVTLDEHVARFVIYRKV